MQELRGYKEAETIKASSSGSLPRGAYEMNILNVELKSGNSGRYLQFDLDVASGDYKGFFDRLYNELAAESKHWRCKFFLNIPEENGTDKDAYKLRMFKTFMNHIEESNSGYHWNWDEKTLVGKKIGGLFVNNEYMGKDGSVRTGTIMARTCSVVDVNNGTYTLPKDRTLQSNKAVVENNTPNGFMSIDDANSVDLPFS